MCVCVCVCVCVCPCTPQTCVSCTLSLSTFLSISVFISSPFSVVTPPPLVFLSQKTKQKTKVCVRLFFLSKKSLAPCRDNSISGVEGLYCKRLIQCLASSPPRRGGRTHSGWRGSGGVNSSEDARHCSVLYICDYFVISGKVPYNGI